MKFRYKKSCLVNYEFTSPNSKAKRKYNDHFLDFIINYNYCFYIEPV